MIPVLAGGRWRLVCRLVANGLGQAWAAIAIAVVVETTFAQIAAGTRPSVPAATGLVAGFGSSIGVTSWLRARERVDAERLGQGYVHDLRLQLFDHLTALSPRAVSDRSTGGTALRFVGDLSAIRRWVSLGLARLAVAATMIAATLIALWSIEPLLAAVTALATGVAAGGSLAVGPGLRAADRDARRRRARLAGRITEAVASVGVIQASGAVPRERRRLARGSDGLRGAMVDRARHLARLGAIGEGSGTAALAALLLGALAAGVDGPSVAAGMTVLGLLVPHLRGLTRVQEYRQGAQVAGEAITRFLDRPARAASSIDRRPLPAGPGRLEFVEVRLGDTIRGLTAVAEPGRTIALVGPNGAGKSTLFSLVAGLLEPDGGRVRLDGVDPAALDPTDLRRAVGIAGPDLPLLRGSVRRNLTYRVPGASEDEVADLLDRCDLGRLVASLPRGLDTRVAEGGANLSAGQRQRLLLARAVLGSPRLLLLDEAEANLDGRTTEVVDRLLAERTGTTIVISHDVRRVAAADEVWLLDGGIVAEAGPPQALLEGDGRTARLFRPDRTSSGVAAGGQTRPRYDVTA
ncbi:MAG: ABC transporter ATP-binding protein [Actinomycetota bacterium]